MTNALSPAHMTPAERLDELAGILAIGITRLQSRDISVNMGDSSLDFTAHQSGYESINNKMENTL